MSRAEWTDPRGADFGEGRSDGGDPKGLRRRGRSGGGLSTVGETEVARVKWAEQRGRAKGAKLRWSSRVDRAEWAGPRGPIRRNRSEGGHSEVVDKRAFTERAVPRWQIRGDWSGQADPRWPV